MIIDAHTHFYDPSRPQGIPWPKPDNEVLYRTVLPEHFKEAAASDGVTGTIAVEASEWMEDNQWLLDLAEKEPFIVGVVGNLEPGSEGFADHLARFAENPLFRGIRLRGKVVDDLESSDVTLDLEMLAIRDLELDLLVREEHLESVTSLAEMFPEMRMVVNHVGGVIVDGRDPNLFWTKSMFAAAECSNVYCKVSGLASATRREPAPVEPGFYTPTLDVLWHAFGEDRLIYGSDWPVCSRYADYPNVMRVVRDYFEGKGKKAAEKYFWKNSLAAYQWEKR
ncbi:MAG: amidohydrolase family protein [Planctomycetes bacterium]|nr:amidohydrolase family protein [Planctomycetota bacterium]